MEKSYVCQCCNPPKSYSRSDVLFKHRRKYDPEFTEYVDVRKTARESYEANGTPCAEPLCDAIIPYEVRNKHRYCSQSCAAKVSNKLRERSRLSCRQNNNRLCAKECRRCASPLKQKQFKYCSLDCSKAQERERFAARRKKLVEDWISGKATGSLANGELSMWAREHTIEQAQFKCSKCAWSEVHPITGRIPLQVDHRDGNYKNNCPENLRVLCPNCHSLTANFGSLNRGNGRTYRVDRMNRSK